MKTQDKSWLILPLLAYLKCEDGTKQISIGWWRRTFTVKF